MYIGHRTHCRPVSPPHHLCPHSGDSWRHFFSSDNGVNNTNYCVVVPKCLALSTTLILANWTELAPRSASATKLRQQLHWLPIRQRITYKISLITYKTRTTGTPTYLSNLIHDYIPTRTLQSSNKLLLTIPRMSLAMSAKSFSLSSP